MGSFLKELEQKVMTNQSLRELKMQRNIFLFGRKSIWSKELYLFDIKTYPSFRVEPVSR